MTTDPSFQLKPNWIVQINIVSLGMDNRLFVILCYRSSKPSKNIRPPKELGVVVWEEGPKSRNWLGLFC